MARQHPEGQKDATKLKVTSTPADAKPGLYAAWRFRSCPELAPSADDLPEVAETDKNKSRIAAAIPAVRRHGKALPESADFFKIPVTAGKLRSKCWPVGSGRRSTRS